MCDVWLTCKGICERHKALKPSESAIGRYSAGQKRCTTCGLFIQLKTGTIEAFVGEDIPIFLGLSEIDMLLLITISRVNYEA
jgi:hypothetical protein